MDPKIVKKTQDSLGKAIKKPPLTEKLLNKPPFRFLHDVITEVIRNTGVFGGLYSENELNSANVTDKEAKMNFLQKAIDCVGIIIGEALTARPSKIVAGHEPEKTNEFLQHVGKICLKKTDTSGPVRKVLAGEKPSGKKKSSGSKSKDDGKESKTKEKGDKDDSSKPSKGSDRKEDKPEKDMKKDKIDDSKEKKEGDDKDKESHRKEEKERRREDKERKPRESSGSSRNKEEKNKEDRKERKSSSKDRESRDKEGGSRDKEESSKPREGSSKQRASSKDRDGSSKDYESSRSKEGRSKDRERSSKEREGSSKERGGSSKDRDDKHSKDRSSKDRELHLREDDARDSDGARERKGSSKERDGGRDKEKGEKERKSEKEKERSREKAKEKDDENENMEPPVNADLPDEGSKNLQRPSSAKGQRRRPGSDDDANNQEKDIDLMEPKIQQEETIQNDSRKMSAMKRPSSARPAPPRIKKQEVQEEQQPRVNSGKAVAPVIVDNRKDQDDDDDDDTFIVEEDPTLQDMIEVKASDSNPDFINTEEHGSLVRKMLESKKEADARISTSKNEEKPIIFDAARKKEREMVEKEIEKLRNSIQLLVRSAHPLGKIMDYVQEDIDSMQKELNVWKDENKKHEQALKAEQSITDNEIAPLRAHLNDIEQEIAEVIDNISVVKSNIIRNEEKIEELVMGVNS